VVGPGAALGSKKINFLISKFYLFLGYIF